MTTAALLEPNVLDVVPGGEAACGLDIRNSGDIVESYQLDVLGDAAGWAAVEPATVSLFPGDATRVAVRFRPSRSGRVPAGDVPFAVRVLPAGRPDAAVVPEGVVRVLPFAETTAEIRPRTSKGHRAARHEVAIDNRGNVPVDVEVSGADPDDALTVSARPSVVTVGAGQAVFTAVHVRHRRTLWRGQPVTRPFQVRVAPEGAPPLALDGTTLQLPVVSRGATRALAGLLVLALLGAGVWFGLLKPAVDSAAKEAVADEIAALAQQNTENARNLAALQEAVATGAGGATATPQPTPAAGGQPLPATVSTAFRHRFQTFVGEGGDLFSNPYIPPEDATLVLTDLFLQAPQGDTGRVDLLVDGVEVFTDALQNVRNSDSHLVSPIEVGAGTPVTIRTRCQEPGDSVTGFSANDRACRVWVTITGFTRTLVSVDETSP